MSRFDVSRDQILIVGGGPTGVTLANELRSRGADCRVIDARRSPATTSRSFTLHARSLEGYARAGYVERLLEQCLRHEAMTIHFPGIAEPERLDFTSLETRYPYIGIIGQNELETALREQLTTLGGEVEWNTRLRSLAVDDKGRLTAVLHHTDSDGHLRREVVRPDWLVGCDGSHSTVRTELGAGHAGEEYTGTTFRMMDVPVDRFPFSGKAIHYFVDERHMLLVTKLPRHYRVLISDMTGTPRRRGELDALAARTEFQRVVDGHAPGTVLGTPEWYTEYKVGRRLSGNFRHGRVLLAGDAAHTHSPAAGMGMNGCVQDAMNLGPRLAAVAVGRAPESVLDGYETERRLIAAQIIEASHRLHQILMAHGRAVQARRAMIQQPGWRHETVEMIAGLTITYRDVIRQPPGVTRLHGLTAGDRAPDIPITTTRRVHDLLAHPDHTLLVIRRDPHSAVATDLEIATAPHRDRLHTVVITAPEITDDHLRCPVLTAETGDVLDRLGHPGTDTVVWVRPDGYVGLRCPARDVLGHRTPITLRSLLEPAVLT